MATLHIEHAITDFPTWKAAFDRFGIDLANAPLDALPSLTLAMFYTGRLARLASEVVEGIFAMRVGDKVAYIFKERLGCHCSSKTYREGV